MSYITGIDLTAIDSTPKFTPGSIGQTADGKKYKYVSYNPGAGSVAAVVGNVAYYFAPSGASAGATTVVTSDLSDSAGLGAGVLQSVLTNGTFGWIQI